MGIITLLMVEPMKLIKFDFIAVVVHITFMAIMMFLDFLGIQIIISGKILMKEL